MYDRCLHIAPFVLYVHLVVRVPVPVSSFFFDGTRFKVAAVLDIMTKVGKRWRAEEETKARRSAVVMAAIEAAVAKQEQIIKEMQAATDAVQAWERKAEDAKTALRSLENELKAVVDEEDRSSDASAWRLTKAMLARRVGKDGGGR